MDIKLHFQLFSFVSLARLERIAHQGERFFHGSNAVVKGFPWIPSREAFDPHTSLTAKELNCVTFELP